MTELVSYLANDNLIMILLLTAFICIILGMGMPTTACYVIVSSVMVPVLHQLIVKQGLNTPPIALHLFVFYFGLLADATPPVGLASYAAAAIAKGNPISTGIQAFMYNLRTMILPFIFVFNSDLILYNVDSTLAIIGIVILSLFGILSLSAGIQGYFLVRNKIWESLFLVVIGLSFLYPKWWINVIYPQFESVQVNYISDMHNIKLGKR